jgi:hypothetical protein
VRKALCAFLIMMQLCVLGFDVNSTRTTFALAQRQDQGTYRIDKPVDKTMLAFHIHFTYHDCKASLYA